MEKWFITMKKADFNEISEKYHISPILARLIRNRDIVGDEAVDFYLNGTIADLYDGMLMKDMDRAVEILSEKIREEKRIRVIGDYDIDGVNATYILQQGLAELGADVDTDIPDRIKDGYGINESIIRAASAEGIDTILTCDNGIAAISQIALAKELGMRMFLFSGGEPLFRKCDILRLCEKHDDCVFLAFTNGTLIDEEFASNMLRVRNFIPAISVEGFEEATDVRRGEGTYKRVERAMGILRSHKLPFGLSCCYTSQNVSVIGSEEYFDWMVDMGAKFCWLFTYMPVGVGSPTHLMVSAEQRRMMYEKVRAFRKTKPIFTIDFWNDGEYVNGCVAGGKYYLHINANGDIEPCAFIHYSDSNIREKSLIKALQSPLFASYRTHQPYNVNHLMPCPLLDNYGKLAEVVKESGAVSTDLEHREDVDELCEKCREKVSAWAVVADELWRERRKI